MPAEKADHRRSLLEEVSRGDLQMILIEKSEARSMVSDLQCAIFNSGCLELCSGSMHGFDDLVRRIEGRTSGFERLLILVESSLKTCHCSSLLRALQLWDAQSGYDARRQATIH